MKILLVEDDKNIAGFISRGLQAKGHVVEHRDDGEQGLRTARAVNWDAIILDIRLPVYSGQEVCRLLRQDGNNTPIMMLTAMDSTEYIIESLRDGADDYMTKPFVFGELLVRLEGFQRRARKTESVASDTKLTYQDLIFDQSALIVERAGNKVSLTSLEYSLLSLFMEKVGAVISREEILQKVWGIHEDPHTNVVDVYISRLRSKVDGPFDTKLINTIRGRGYRFGSKQV